MLVIPASLRSTDINMPFPSWPWFASQRSENDICIFCRTKKDSFFDLLWLCGEMSCVWQGFMKWLTKKPNKTKIQHFHFQYTVIIGLSSDTLSNTRQYFKVFAARFLHMILQNKGSSPKNRMISYFSFLLSTFRILNL